MPAGLLRTLARPSYRRGRGAALDFEWQSEGKQMNHDRIEGKWKKVKGKLKERWGKLTDDDLDVIAGRRDQLLGRIQERHGIAKDQADRQVKDWEGRNPDLRLEK